MKEYIHQTGEEIRAIGGGYQLQGEALLEFGGRQVLYVLGFGVFDTTCCGTGGCRYALTPGFVVEYKTSLSPEGFPVSQVEPITDPELRRQITRDILEKEVVQQVQFW
ncbi:MAG: hypothetical protein V1816_18445 [Pseudomonadota bacterium]